jgi:hypothetical protein
MVRPPLALLREARTFLPLLSDDISAQVYDLPSPPHAKSPSVPLNYLLPEASLKDVISMIRPGTAERGVNHAGEEGHGEEGHGEESDGEESDGEEGHGEESDGEEGHGEEGHGSSFVSARKDGRASSRNAFPSRIHADRVRPVGRSDRHRLTTGRLPAPRGQGSGSHPW